MNKQQCIEELKRLIVELQTRSEVTQGLVSRVNHLCDLLDAFEHEGR